LYSYYIIGILFLEKKYSEGGAGKVKKLLCGKYIPLHI